jgi:hypothetical protein
MNCEAYNVWLYMAISTRILPQLMMQLKPCQIFQSNQLPQRRDTACERTTRVLLLAS